MKRIVLTQGKCALVDDEDFEYLMQWKWFYSDGYAGRWENKKRVAMHRVLMKVKDGELVDHRNGDSLDNRKENLRVCNKQENARNCGKKAKASSQFKGVSWSKTRNKWVVRICIGESKMVHIGHFNSEIHAAMAWDLWARDIYGDFARTNFDSISFPRL